MAAAVRQQMPQSRKVTGESAPSTLHEKDVPLSAHSSMKFELFVALRYLRAKRKQTMISVISGISVLGIAAGVMALVIALALTTGFQEDIKSKILGATPAIHILRIDQAPLDYEELLRKIGNVPHITGSAPAILKPVFIASAVSNQGATMKGIDPNLEIQVSDFFSHIVAGDPHALEKAPAPCSGDSAQPRENILIGKAMAKALGVAPGDTLDVFNPMGRMTPVGMTVAKKTMCVAGLFESGLWDIDSNWAYVNINTARRLFSFPQQSALILQFKIDDLDRTETIADEILQKASPGTGTRTKLSDSLITAGRIRPSAGSEYITTTWIELNKPLFSALKYEKILSFIIIGLIVFVASLNIVTTLIMMVLEKQSDIAILAAMGATSKNIRRVFMLQGLIIGVMGTAIGDVLGMTASWVLNHYHIIKLQAEIYSIPYVPFHLKIWDSVLISATALLISFLATIYPAINASRLDPVEVMRYE
jgi:lipoprotein-releasing system permease protein